MAEEPKVPPAPRLTESEQRAQTLYQDLWNDSELGAAVRAKAKQKFPEVILPEEPLAPVLEPLRADNKALRERLEAIEAERKAEREAAAQSKADTDFQQRIEAAKRAFNLNGEGFDKMIARMKETQNFTDAEAAAAWVAAQNPPPAPKTGASWAPQSVDFYGTKNKDENFALLHNDPQEYADEQFRQFAADPVGFTNETLGFQ